MDTEAEWKDFIMGLVCERRLALAEMEARPPGSRKLVDFSCLGIITFIPSAWKTPPGAPDLCLAAPPCHSGLGADVTF